MMRVNNKLKTSIVLLCVFLLALAFRLNASHFPFWTDEYSTASQAQLILKFVSHMDVSKYSFETNNIVTHVLVATSFKLFGVGETQARLPMMFAGSLVPVMIFLFAKKRISMSVALSSSALYIFSYMQITWARQARGYVIQQLFVMMAIYLYFDILERRSKKNIALFILIVLLGLFTHTTFVFCLAALAIHAGIYFRTEIISAIRKPITYIFLAIAVLLSYATGQMHSISVEIQSFLSAHINNLGYYHSFLWREETVVSVLAALGIVLSIRHSRTRKVGILLLLLIIFYIVFFVFGFAPYVSRYLLAIFPALYLFAGVGVSEIAGLISKKHLTLVAIVTTMFIIANGDAFTIKPKQYYSVDHKMREIALIDYDQVYGLIKAKLVGFETTTAIIDPWPDRLKWYMGENQSNFFAFRWIDEPGLVNGLEKKTPFLLDEQGNKILPKSGSPPIKLIGGMSDLQKALDTYPHGFIFIDDSSLPADVIAYANEHFKKELYLDHYQYDDNPYSIWPATLYSWGFDDPE